jgi:Ca2+-binding EF-hand superfamily protein
LTSVLAAACALAPPAQGASSERFQEIFRQLDTDADGQVSAAEFETNKISVFGLRDANADYSLERTEVDLDPDQFRAVDQNGDGQISGLEFVDSSIGRFEVYDMDGNGSLTLDELVNTAASSASSP